MKMASARRAIRNATEKIAAITVAGDRAARVLKAQVVFPASARPVRPIATAGNADRMVAEVHAVRARALSTAHWVPA